MTRRIVVWLAVAGCLALFVWLRAPGIGHLLMWDEANDVCAARALASGAGDIFAPRIWIHPPALPTLSLMVKPLAEGFAERYEAMVLVINACALLVLFLVNRAIYGTTIALWSSFFLAVLPGAVFYDVWIKGGCVVSLATLGAVASLLSGKPLLCGLCLGIGLLDKETAVLPCIAVGILALMDARHRNVRTVAALVIVTACTAGWWYVCLSSTMAHWLRCATGRAWDASCAEPWHKYFVWLYRDLGLVGTLLLAGGILAMVTWRVPRLEGTTVGTYAWWPVLLVAMVLGVLTMCRNKSPWFTMFLYPGLATIQAAATARLIGAATVRLPRLRAAWLAGAAACMVLMVVEARTRQFEEEQRHVFKYVWYQAARSRDLARAVNDRATADDTLLLTTFSFHDGDFRLMASPIFAFYLTNLAVLPVQHFASFDFCAGRIASNRLTLALLTPMPGAEAAALTNGFKTRFGLEPEIMDNGTAFFYRTSAVAGGR